MEKGASLDRRDYQVCKQPLVTRSLFDSIVFYLASHREIMLLISLFRVPIKIYRNTFKVRRNITVAHGINVSLNLFIDKANEAKAIHSDELAV